ncbi:hypothetical protein Taro_050832 [Colocasia esculenta]|uniref:Uncharacterized protein n=1 Tax=Colocasia esculenta TaxID=4460 RepID=A0A843XF34_COLES|nr:hypothetical protein [Colocasia esculenta]
MGICTSCEATAVASTTKVIMEDGQLREFSGPVSAAQVLRKDLGCFVCNADDMELDDYVTAVGSDEELRPGQLYFVLPRSMLRRRLLPEEMAALAVKASSSLVKSGAAAAFGAGMDGAEDCGAPAAPLGGFSVGSRVAHRRRGKGSSRGRNFASQLSAIPE